MLIKNISLHVQNVILIVLKTVSLFLLIFSIMLIMIKHTGERHNLCIPAHRGKKLNHMKIHITNYILKDIYLNSKIVVILCGSITCFRIKYYRLESVSKIMKAHSQSHIDFSNDISLISNTLLLISNETRHHCIIFIYLSFPNRGHWIITIFILEDYYEIRFLIIFVIILKWIWKVS